MTQLPRMAPPTPACFTGPHAMSCPCPPTGDLQEMRKRVEAVAVTMVDGLPAEAGLSTKGKERNRCAAVLKSGKDTVA
jgi:hypothetical protein